MAKQRRNSGETEGEGELITSPSPALEVRTMGEGICCEHCGWVLLDVDGRLVCPECLGAEPEPCEEE